jgi:glycosyltransferase involved in cell wall biosynthesis
MSGAPQFTVFTSTYNRAHTIHRVYDSLRSQTLGDLEWLVVDDGSTDATPELVANWARTATFPIRYVKQQHSGKHIAHNLAVCEARGQLFVPLDSDDACVPQALERLAHHWNAIPVAQQPHYSGVVCLCCNQFGTLVGDRFPGDSFDGDLREMIYVHRVRGEKWLTARTDVLRRHPFAEIRDTQFIPEFMVWLEIAKSYKMRFVNEALRIYYVDDEMTGTVLSKRQRLGENAPGRLHYYVWLINNDLSFFFYSPMPFLKAAMMLPIVARASRQPFINTLTSLNTWPARALVLLTLPISVLFQVLFSPSLVYAVDKIRAHARARK